MVAYRVVVRGALPGALRSVLRQRFGAVRLEREIEGAHRGCTAIECAVRDQAALRALLTQVWDVGGEVVLLTDVTSAAPDAHRSALGQEIP